MLTRKRPASQASTGPAIPAEHDKHQALRLPLLGDTEPHLSLNSRPGASTADRAHHFSSISGMSATDHHHQPGGALFASNLKHEQLPLRGEVALVACSCTFAVLVSYGVYLTTVGQLCVNSLQLDFQQSRGNGFNKNGSSEVPTPTLFSSPDTCSVYHISSTMTASDVVDKASLDVIAGCWMFFGGIFLLAIGISCISQLYSSATHFASCKRVNLQAVFSIFPVLWTVLWTVLSAAFIVYQTIPDSNLACFVSSDPYCQSVVTTFSRTLNMLGSATFAGAAICISTRSNLFTPNLMFPAANSCSNVCHTVLWGVLLSVYTILQLGMAVCATASLAGADDNGFRCGGGAGGGSGQLGISNLHIISFISLLACLESRLVYFGIEHSSVLFAAHSQQTRKPRAWLLPRGCCCTRKQFTFAILHVLALTAFVLDVLVLAFYCSGLVGVAFYFMPGTNTEGFEPAYILPCLALLPAVLVLYDLGDLVLQNVLKCGCTRQVISCCSCKDEDDDLAHLSSSPYSDLWAIPVATEQLKQRREELDQASLRSKWQSRAQTFLSFPWDHSLNVSTAKALTDSLIGRWDSSHGEKGDVMNIAKPLDSYSAIAENICRLANKKMGTVQSLSDRLDGLVLHQKPPFNKFVLLLMFIVPLLCLWISCFQRLATSGSLLPNASRGARFYFWYPKILAIPPVLLLVNFMRTTVKTIRALRAAVKDSLSARNVDMHSMRSISTWSVRTGELLDLVKLGVGMQHGNFIFGLSVSAFATAIFATVWAILHRRSTGESYLDYMARGGSIELVCIMVVYFAALFFLLWELTRLDRGILRSINAVEMRALAEPELHTTVQLFYKPDGRGSASENSGIDTSIASIVSLDNESTGESSRSMESTESNIANLPRTSRLLVKCADKMWGLVLPRESASVKVTAAACSDAVAHESGNCNQEETAPPAELRTILYASTTAQRWRGRYKGIEIPFQCCTLTLSQSYIVSLVASAVGPGLGLAIRLVVSAIQD